MTAREKVNVAGAIMYEVALAYGTGFLTEAASAMKFAESKLGLQARLKSFGINSEKVVKAIEDFLQALHKPFALAALRARGCCLAGCTPLLTPEGAKCVEDFRPEDWVLSRCEIDAEGSLEAKQVEEIFVRVALIYAIGIGGQVIRTTGEHPFYIVGKGWVQAAWLAVGNLCVGHDGTRKTVDGVEETRSVQTVYNLRVADYHTYFVGSPEWGFSVWAHNFSCGDLADLLGLARDDSRVTKARSYLTETSKPTQAGLEVILKEGGQTLPRSTKANGQLPQSDRLKQAIEKTRETASSAAQQGGPSRLHPDSSLKPSSLDFWGKQSDQAIVHSLRTGKVPGGTSGPLEPMVVESGVIKQGNHRVKVLQDRGYNTQEIIDMVEGRRPVGNPSRPPAPGTAPAQGSLSKEEAERRLFGPPLAPPPSTK